MEAVVNRGPRTVAVEEVPDPTVQAPTDAIVRLTTTNICGSELHMYEGRSSVEEGKVVGHESAGVVEEVGSAVDRIRVGDRVPPRAAASTAASRRSATRRTTRPARSTRSWCWTTWCRSSARPAASAWSASTTPATPATPAPRATRPPRGGSRSSTASSHTSGQSMGTGQCPTERYNRQRDLITAGRATPSFIVCHELPLEQAPDAYARFDAREDGWTKVLLHPGQHA